MKHLSFETCERLKDAGFPQPKVNQGQFWYHETGDLVITYNNLLGLVLSSSMSSQSIHRTDPDYFSDFNIYCPTAFDLLNATPNISILKNDDGIEIYGLFAAGKLEAKTESECAEIIAQIWLSRNKQK